MTSHIANVVSDSMEWISFGMRAQQKPLISPINPTHFEKLLGFTTPQAADMESVLPSKYLQHQAYLEDDLSDLMEEDVWGDDDTSSFDNDNNMTPSSKQLLDSDSDSHFSALFDEGAGESRVTGIFSPSQFSPVIMCEREAMRGQIFDSPHIMSSKRGTSGVINGTHNTIGTSPHKGSILSDKNFLSSYGPRSASVEVPIWSKLRVMMKNGGTFLGLDASDDDDDDDDVSVQRVPPHELLAKQHARSQISAFSVIEGTGRTLKGRDVSKVRDAVWKQTGFSG